ncbi:hypothetical protein OS493_001349 [Desmophyllum pertusum]|uniref:Uncharacterized protein n=1 Tax=Desmophyllum pertusum TaxID=174260 RepID=A0A9W9ZIH1_9CNID|nr:hypothetical protein OS493_001349 [Desmophyllum pertusum]
MAQRKGSSPFFRVIDEDDVLSSQKNWYILSSKLCGINPTQYFKRSTTVSGFQEEFFLVGSGSLRLVDGSNYVPKGSLNGFEVVCSTFGLVAVLLRQKYLDECVLCKLKEVLNTGTVDFSEDVESSRDQRPRAACNAGHAGRATDVYVIVNDPSTKRKFEVFIDLVIDPPPSESFKVFEIDVIDLVIDPSIKRQFEVVKFSKFKGDKRQR